MDARSILAMDDGIVDGRSGQMNNAKAALFDRRLMAVKHRSPDCRGRPLKRTYRSFELEFPVCDSQQPVVCRA